MGNKDFEQGNNVWSGSEVISAASTDTVRKITIPVGGKYVDKDIELTITVPKVEAGGGATTQEVDANDVLEVSSHQFASFSVAASTNSGTKTLTVSKPGYYPIGIVGYYITGTASTYQNITYMRITSRSVGSATVSYNARNFNTSTTSQPAITVDILWWNTNKVSNYSDYISIQEASNTHASLASNSSSTYSFSISKADWTPLGVVGFLYNGTTAPTYKIVSGYRINNRANGSGTFEYTLRNTYSSSTNGTFTGDVLWVKPDKINLGAFYMTYVTGNVAGNSTVDLTDDTPFGQVNTGIKLLGCAGFRCNGDGSTYMMTIINRLTSSGYRYYWRNNTNTARTNNSMVQNFLCVRTLKYS